ncbi:uncharacterized protein A4U43_C02F10990 [Asparagus officinalis]|uniref:UPF0261 domain-containing protein n=1 Tax=Asparagus officinalis TaxID=4686 RepID=A0A5P1FHL9_ASPOF|nr:uncharacterized protein A4U43_C02F10990 [Asparagus officinalis]
MPEQLLIVGKLLARDASADMMCKPTVGITMFGVTTTPCVTAVKEGYETLVFHATGVGGKAMEELGVLDVTTTEVADYVVGGVMACDGSRFDAIIEKKIPLVLMCRGLRYEDTFGLRLCAHACRHVCLCCQQISSEANHFDALQVKIIPCHINYPNFADALVDSLLEMNISRTVNSREIPAFEQKYCPSMVESSTEGKDTDDRVIWRTPIDFPDAKPGFISIEHAIFAH